MLWYFNINAALFIQTSFKIIVISRQEAAHQPERVKQQLRKAQAELESMEKQVQAMQQGLADAEASSEEFKAAAVEAEADLLTAQEDTVAQVAAITRRPVSIKP